MWYLRSYYKAFYLKWWRKITVTLSHYLRWLVWLVLKTWLLIAPLNSLLEVRIKSYFRNDPSCNKKNMHKCIQVRSTSMFIFKSISQEWLNRCTKSLELEPEERTLSLPSFIRTWLILAYVKNQLLGKLVTFLKQ